MDRQIQQYVQNNLANIRAQISQHRPLLTRRPRRGNEDVMSEVLSNLSPLLGDLGQWDITVPDALNTALLTANSSDPSRNRSLFTTYPGQEDIFILPAITVRRRRNPVPTAPSPSTRTDTLPPVVTPGRRQPFRPRTGTVDNCPICLDPVTQRDRHLTPCGHQYHQRCFREMVAHNDGQRLRCSLCNAYLP